jgi:hypothetical protein
MIERRPWTGVHGRRFDRWYDRRIGAAPVHGQLPS